MTTIVDISRAKQAEIQLRRKQEELEAELHVTQRLHRMSMRAVRENASVRIHDVREDDDYGPLLDFAAKLGYRSIQVTPLAGIDAAHSDGPGKGAELVIELELADASDCASSPDESGESASPPRWRVLVVDDDRDNAQSMSILLESLGQESRVALDGISALAVVREFKPHIVFLDLTMPGMSGHEVARRLRAEESADWPVKLVALSGRAEKSTPLNFDHYLMKPAAIGDILDLLDSLSHD